MSVFLRVCVGEVWVPPARSHTAARPRASRERAQTRATLTLCILFTQNSIPNILLHLLKCDVLNGPCVLVYSNYFQLSISHRGVSS